jgi:prepilin-type N-terminal cleavage/methylation domain-containing protein
VKKGYTLLEVLVAIVIISSIIVAVFQIFSLAFRNLEKFHTYEDLYVSMTNLMESMNAITDFDTNKEGRGTIGTFTYAWQAIPASPPRRLTLYGGEFGPYDIILYKIMLTVFLDSKGATGNSRDYTFYRTGWRYAQK